MDRFQRDVADATTRVVAVYSDSCMYCTPQRRLPEIAQFGRPGRRVRTIAVLSPRVLPLPWSMPALVKGFGVALERLLSARSLPFDQPALSAQT